MMTSKGKTNPLRPDPEGVARDICTAIFGTECNGCWCAEAAPIIRRVLASERKAALYKCIQIAHEQHDPATVRAIYALIAHEEADND